MIKRYGFGQKSIQVGSNTSVNIPDLVEREDGDYVRYEDYVVALESVSERIAGKTLRDKFAMAAVAGMDFNDVTFHEVAHDAYKTADAMLKRRKK